MTGVEFLMATDDGPGLELEVITGGQLFMVVTVVAFLAGSWVYWDARRREIDNPGIWAAAIAFLFLFYVLPGLGALIVYIVMRGSEPGDGDRSP